MCQGYLHRTLNQYDHIMTLIKPIYLAQDIVVCVFLLIKEWIEFSCSNSISRRVYVQVWFGLQPHTHTRTLTLTLIPTLTFIGTSPPPWMNQLDRKTATHRYKILVPSFTLSLEMYTTSNNNQSTQQDELSFFFFSILFFFLDLSPKYFYTALYIRDLSDT